MWYTIHLGVLYTDELPRDLVPRLAEQERVLANLTLVHVYVDLAHTHCSVDVHLHLTHNVNNIPQTYAVGQEDIDIHVKKKKKKHDGYVIIIIGYTPRFPTFYKIFASIRPLQGVFFRQTTLETKVADAVPSHEHHHHAATWGQRIRTVPKLLRNSWRERVLAKVSLRAFLQTNS